MRCPRLLAAAHAHHGHHVHTAALGHQPAGGAPVKGQVRGLAFLDLELLLKVLRPGVVVGDVGREVDHLQLDIAPLRHQEKGCLVCAQSLGVMIEGHIDGGRLSGSDVEHRLAQGIELRIARHGVELQWRRTRIDELEGLGEIAAGDAVVDGLHTASVVAHQQVGGIHVDAAAGNAVDAEAVAREEAEAVVACREPGDPFRVVQRVLELIGIHPFPLVAAIDRLLDGHVGLRVDDGSRVTAVAILQREDHGVVDVADGQRGCHEPVAGPAAAKDGRHGCHAATSGIIVRGDTVLHHEAFAKATHGQLVVVEVDCPCIRIGDDGSDGDACAIQARILGLEINHGFVLANGTFIIMERDVQLGRVAGGDAEFALVDAEQLGDARRDVDLQRARTGIDHDELLRAVLGTHAVIHKVGVQTIDRDEQVGCLVVDMEARHAVYLRVDIGDEAETVFALRGV